MSELIPKKEITPAEMDGGQEEKKETRLFLPQFGDRRIIKGVTYEYVNSGYTLRQYYAHSTPEKGPGPGWDTRTILLNDTWAMERFGRTFSDKEVWNIDSTQLPDLPLGIWEVVEGN